MLRRQRLAYVRASLGIGPRAALEENAARSDSENEVSTAAGKGRYVPVRPRKSPAPWLAQASHLAPTQGRSSKSLHEGGVREHIPEGWDVGERNPRAGIGRRGLIASEVSL